MNNPRIGMVGLGSIAQKAYLPILAKETDWSFVGAFSPNKQKRKQICGQYRIGDFHLMAELANQCDAVLVHSSTDSHYEVVSALLSNGVDVYVDKPLAASMTEAEKLVELSKKYNRKLMVGFNRRFAPMYVAIKELATDAASIRVEKHRLNSIGPGNVEFTMLDDYLHVVDTVRWLGSDRLEVLYGDIQVNRENQLLYTQHLFKSGNQPMTTAMHRSAGTNLEKIELIVDGAIIRVKNMNVTEVEKENAVTTTSASSWESIVKQRGFEDAVSHFIDCVRQDEQPVVDGEEGLKSQALLDQLLK
ncbi:Gfo/Idh/MocA family protein [Virgibacillus salarius]